MSVYPYGNFEDTAKPYPIEKKYMADAEYMILRFKKEHPELIGKLGQYDPLALVGFVIKKKHEETNGNR